MTNPMTSNPTLEGAELRALEDEVDCLINERLNERPDFPPEETAKRVIAAVLNTLLQQQRGGREDEWYPIAHAPLTGERVDLWGAYAFGGRKARRIADCTWAANWIDGQTNPRWEDEQGRPVHNVTHWRPLPTPPRQGDSQ